ncbi:MAG: glycosyltransferase family 2 protein [Actinobacteria bacterium]|nr:glycosyltransferase family 2 protein [Actinomycetota bacterium]MBT3687573.1 glycosyltransferase family 2 protein [Actinomycetota bacterium]MBT4036433.1 glycosyltransferase family 2 protein [Actinomycetota bacterium]MBT4278824.1 glycosyltransferase family 2 protein [Actinomycetota bacterium]MBT4343218.1 glycosyltransferase family 2 protein [Actinomycetota bacterium]
MAHDPGEWFDDVLAGLAAQDHRLLDVVVVDAGRKAGLSDRVLNVLPDARTVEAPGSPGFGAAANRAVVGASDGQADGGTGPNRIPSYHLFMHDDVVLDGTAVRRMVERAVAANAGVVGPKVLVGTDGRILHDMGSTVDRYGSPVPRLHPGEVDQGQYDATPDVFAVAEAALLVRTDLFAAVGGFDPEIRFLDGHIDLCWRARLAGATVTTAPTAVGRTVSRDASARRGTNPVILRPRHRLRMSLTNQAAGRSATVVAELAAATVLGVAYGLLTGRFRHVWGLVSAWPWNLGRHSGVRNRRRIIARHRRVDPARVVAGPDMPHHAIRRAVTGRAPYGTGDEAPGNIAFHNIWSALLGPGGIALMASAAVLGFGSRHLLTRGLPAVGRLQALPADPMDLVRSWWHGWRPTGTGVATTGPDALALLGVVARLMPGSDNLIWTAVVLAALPVGALGVWRLVRPVGGGRSRAAAVLTYLAVPLPYDALREGRLAPLAVYASLPWIAHRLAEAQGVVPYGHRGGDPGPGTRIRNMGSDILLTGLVVAAAIAIDPTVVVVLPVLVGGLVVGSLLAGSVAGLTRLVTVAAGGAVVAAIVQLPLLFNLVDNHPLDSLAVPTTWPRGSLGTAAMFTLDTGSPLGGPSWAGTFGIDRIGWTVLVVPALALVTATGWRLAISIRAAFVVAGGFASVWLVDQGWWQGPTLPPELLLVPVALGLAWAAAAAVADMGTTSSMPRRGPSWRNALPAVAGLALALTVLPVVVGSLGGRLGMPEADLPSALPFIAEPRAGIGETTRGGDGRVLWVGEPTILPAVGVPLSDDPLSGEVAVAVTDGSPDLLDQWPYDLTGAPGVAEIRDALAEALAGRTSRLGAAIGAWGVDHVVLVERSAPAPHEAIEAPLPPTYAAAITRQLDMARVEGLNSAVTIFENIATRPVHAVVRDRTGRVVPAAVTPLAYDRLQVQASADGAYRWILGPEGSWSFSVDGITRPLVPAGEAGGVPGRPSVRVASGTIGELVHDGASSRSRRLLQVAALCGVLLLASWLRTDPEPEWP